ncbi:MAG: hypothetical protein NC084_01360 [Bacteroides sp.]|nr:hypothetical protein [Roseburia sp.]MCM1461340.1 hypothetical protein [Bacteroides sp.]
MRRAAALIGAFLALLLFTLPSYAESGVKSKNRLAAYQSAEWTGDPLEYDPGSGTLAFSGEGAAKSAALVLETEGARGFWFYTDLGNFENAGVGGVFVELLDGDGNVLEKYETDKTAGDGSFHRYTLGDEESYARLPDGTEALRLTLFFESGTTPYFRNLGLYLDGAKPVNADAPEWRVSGKLTLVQVGVTKTQYWSWVFLIAAVPIVMYGARKWLERTKKMR